MVRRCQCDFMIEQREIRAEIATASLPRLRRRAWSIMKRPVAAVDRRLKRTLLGTIIGVETNRKVASLTFDDGPDPKFTPKILDVLARYEARATFFIVGQSARKHPKLVEEIVCRGHAIGNHTWNHRSLPSLTRSERHEQIISAQRAMNSFGQKLMRPPFGHLNAAARFDATLCGYKVVTWTLAVHDWENRTAQSMAECVQRNMKPGNIILFHDSIFCDWSEDEPAHYDRSNTIAALEIILERFKSQYRFVTVPELLRAGKPVKRYWKVETSEDWKSLAYRW